MNVCILQMIYYDRIEVSEEIDINKTTASKECNVCHYLYFLNYEFKFQPIVRNRCNDSLIMSINLSDIAILNIKGSDYRCMISLISKNKTLKLIQNADLTKKPNIIKHKNLFSYTKMGEAILTFGNIEIEKNKFYHTNTPIFGEM